MHISIYTYTRNAHKKRNMKRLNLLASLYVGGGGGGGWRSEKQQQAESFRYLYSHDTRQEGWTLLSAITCVGKRIDSAEWYNMFSFSEKN